VALTPDEGVCEVVVEETDNRVEVLILVCGEIEDPDESVDCPVHVYLSRALGGREVVDAARGGATIERFTPNW
jgi:hypothetical protein